MGLINNFLPAVLRIGVPGFIVHNAARMRCADAELASKLPEAKTFCAILTNTPHVMYRELQPRDHSMRVFGSKLTLVALFGNHIVHVVLMSAKKEMVGIRAVGVVAFVKHANVFGERGIIRKYVRNAVRQIIDALDNEHGIAVLRLTLPQPALGGFSNVY